MKRLFQVVNLSTGKVIRDTSKVPFYFNHKMDAKGLRDTMNEDAGHIVTKVSLGPDHWKNS